MSDPSTERANTLAEYLHVLRRRKWFVVIPLVVVPAVALLFSLREPPVYQATSEVLLNRQNVVGAVTGTDTSTPYLDPTRAAVTQSDVARSPVLLRRIVQSVGVAGLTPDDILAHSSVTPRPDADLLNFSYQSRDPKVAARVATTYGRLYTDFRRELDTTALNQAKEKVQSKIDALQKRGISPNSPLYASLIESLSKLETAATLQTQNTMLLKQAQDAPKISPRPKRNLIVGVGLGLILGLVLAFVAEALDSRVRSEREIEEHLGSPLLARLPSPSRTTRKGDGLAILAEPRSVAAETVRKLRTNVEYATGALDARVVLVTSALAQEGKSTTIANLAVALAEAGRRVGLVDLDLRRPYLHRFFRRTASPGVTDMLLGRSTLEETIGEAGFLMSSPNPWEFSGLHLADDAPAPHANGRQTSRSEENGNSVGTLLLVTAGSATNADPAVILESQKVADLLGALRKRCDVVLVDAPPVLAVGDVMILSALVDAIVVVVGRQGLSRAVLRDLTRELNGCRAPRLGFVIAGSAETDVVAYGYRYGYERAGRSRDVTASRTPDR